MVAGEWRLSHTSGYEDDAAAVPLPPAVAVGVVVLEGLCCWFLLNGNDDVGGGVYSSSSSPPASPSHISGSLTNTRTFGGADDVDEDVVNVWVRGTEVGFSTVVAAEVGTVCCCCCCCRGVDDDEDDVVVVGAAAFLLSDSCCWTVRRNWAFSASNCFRYTSVVSSLSAITLITSYSSAGRCSNVLLESSLRLGGGEGDPSKPSPPPSISPKTSSSGCW